MSDKHAVFPSDPYDLAVEYYTFWVNADRRSFVMYHVDTCNGGYLDKINYLNEFARLLTDHLKDEVMGLGYGFSDGCISVENIKEEPDNTLLTFSGFF